jgi:hypothetical protein
MLNSGLFRKAIREDCHPAGAGQSSADLPALSPEEAKAGVGVQFVRIVAVSMLNTFNDS